MSKDISLKEAIDKVFKELSDVPVEEFKKMLEEHKDGDIAQMLMDIWSMSKEIWKPFWFEGNMAWGQINSPKDWERIKEAYNGEMFPLERARRFDDARGPYFGFASECRGKETLIDFAAKHHMKL